MPTYFSYSKRNNSVSLQLKKHKETCSKNRAKRKRNKK